MKSQAGIVVGSTLWLFELMETVKSNSQTLQGVKDARQDEQYQSDCISQEGKELT